MVSIDWASADVARYRFDVQHSGGLRRWRRALEPDKHLCSRIDSSEIDLRVVPVCSGGHRRNFLGVDATSRFAVIRDRSRRTDEEMANQSAAVMVSPKKRMCAHMTCLCIPPDGEEYCSAGCLEAGRDDVEIACQCDHSVSLDEPRQIKFLALASNRSTTRVPTW